MKRIEYLIKHNNFIQLMYRWFFSFLFKTISLFVPVDRKLILMSSFSGKKFNDSPKAIYDKMHEKGLLSQYYVVWAFEEPTKFSQFNLNTVRINSFKYFLTAFKAKYWITNVNIERGLSFKKSNQCYLNTWHGTGPKTIGNAANGRKDYNFKKTNYLCADGEFLRDIFINNFNAKKENILLCGRPREDVLYKPNESLIKNLKEKYKILDSDFVILYAPTWREQKNSFSLSTFENQLDIEKILSTFPNSKILFRAHSITSNVVMSEHFDNRFISVTDEPEISHLYLISNILITDYSSSVLDFTILNKPFICFAPDYEKYLSERSLCFDLKKTYPFGVQHSTDDVINVINKIRKNNARLNDFMNFKKKYAPYGGNATNKCIEVLFGNKERR